LIPLKTPVSFRWTVPLSMRIWHLVFQDFVHKIFPGIHGNSSEIYHDPCIATIWNGSYI
jgi:hypothetical protein